uniref:Chromo domain-containing protein n=1 Tax=Globisporangium ultimum (strain ATCC 200006 / CBS 805.95 / DAOM BR144) TaxID=431595 RepID=K3WR41_GLOUD
MRRLHNAPNVDVLRHFVENPNKLSSRPLPKFVPVYAIDDADATDLYVVEELRDTRMFNRQRGWLVKWAGLDEHGNSWEREKKIRACSALARIAVPISRNSAPNQAREDVGILNLWTQNTPVT